MAKAKKVGRKTDSRGRVSVGQVENLRDNLLPVPTSETEDASKPRMPFKTAYILTREQEDELCDYAHKWLLQREDQLGRTSHEASGGGKRSQKRASQIDNPESFFGKRERFSRLYYGHVDHRVKPDTIYEQSNLTGALAQRITMQMIARGNKYFFGEPDDIDWFSTQAVGAEDELQSDKIKKHSRWKVDQCGVKTRFIEAIEYAFIRGEAIVKPTHQQRFQIYKCEATILMGGLNAAGVSDPTIPLLDAHGDYIVQGDAFVPQIQAVPPVATEQPVDPSQAPEQQVAQEPQMQETGKLVLKRDGVTAIPELQVWNTQIIARQLITFEGPELAVVYFKDFLCPESATDIQTADAVCHLYDMDVMHIAKMFRGVEGEGDDAIANIQAAVDRIREMTGESNLPKASAKQPREDFKESDTAGPAGVPLCQIAELHMTYDADGDGLQEEIMFFLDRAHKAPIYYEYEANVTVRGIRPFYAIRPMPVDQRWYGLGSMELFDLEQEFVDLQINRYNFAKSKAGRIDFWNPAGTVEGNRDPNLKLNYGQTYGLRDGKKIEDVYGFVEVPFDGDNLEYLLSLYMQMMQLKSGVVNSGDQEMSGLPSSDLATGINEIRDSGEELFSRILSHLFPGVKEALKAVIDIIYANMNRQEVFTYFNGDADEILTLTPEDVRDLALNVTLELSRTQQRRAVEVGKLTQDTISWFYQNPPELQARLAPYVRKQLKAFGIAQADSIIEPMTPHRSDGPVDKPSAVMNALAALIKAGTPITVDDINAALVKAGLPPVAGIPTSLAAPPPPPPALTNGAEEPAAEPTSAV